MSITYLQARDDMFNMVNDAWNASTMQKNDLFWDAVPKDRPTNQLPWAVVYLRHVTGGQRTLGGVGFREFERLGVIIITVFAPIGKGLSESYQLAKVLSDAFEGNSSPLGVWFRDAAIQEIGSEGDFYQVNFTVNFTYSETK